MSWPFALVLLALMACNMVILGTTAYVVFWLGHSGWWFLLALCLCGGSLETAEKATAKRGRE